MYGSSVLHRESHLSQSATDAVNKWRWIISNLLKPEHPFEIHKYLHHLVFSNWDAVNGPPPAWIPSDIDATNLVWLMKKAGANSYDELYQWSITERENFWTTMVERLGVHFSQPYSRVLDTSSGIERPVWFSEAKLNIVESCFNAPDDSVAIVSQADDSDLAELSISELREMVARVANALPGLGLSPGDAVAIYMEMTVEAVAVFLGIIAAGCRVVSIASSFPPDEIRIRLGIGQAKCVFTQDSIFRMGKILPLYDNLVTAGAPRAIVVPRNQSPDVSLRTRDMAWEDFLSDDTNFTCVPCDPAATSTILFSSGTTGAPKAIPWDHTTPIKSAIDGHMHQDIRSGDVVCWPTNLGWMMGPWLVYATLMNRATIALDYGAPTTKAFGEFVQNTRVTMLGLVPSMVSAWRANGCLDGLDWSAIRSFSSTGECSNAEDMLFLMSRAGYKPIIEYCGGTEIGGGYITGTVIQPAVPAAFSTPALGSEILILDDNGKEVDEGELFLIPPAIGLSSKLLNRDHREEYYSNTPAGPGGLVLRRHGDQMQRLGGGYFRALGRVDDTMNISGIKVSSQQIEEVVCLVDGVASAAAVAISPPDNGPAMLVVYMVAEPSANQKATHLKSEMQHLIRSKLNPLIKIHDVVLIEELPRTATNKIMRRSLRAVYEQQVHRETEDTGNTGRQ